jgi:N-acetylglutamate synthase-like GNAT family acetyltransferase
MSGVRVEQASPHDLAAMEALLTANQLPTVGLRDSLGTALVARVGSRTIGSVALEVYPSGVLLRSVAVDTAWRGRGIGHQLTSAALDLARNLGADAAYLLTTTAGDFFPRFGFTPVERPHVPDDVKQSIEFRSACPSSALVMRAALNGHGHAVSLPGHSFGEGR